MRSLNKFLKVEGHDSLIRDMSSHAIISNSDSDYEAYRRRRILEKQQYEILQNQSKDIDSLKSDIEQIKKMLAQLLAGT